MLCNNCGAEVDEGSAYCLYCGQPITAQSGGMDGSSSHRYMECPRCGSRHDDGASFCTNCGYQFVQSKEKKAVIDRSKKYVSREKRVGSRSVPSLGLLLIFGAVVAMCVILFAFARSGLLKSLSPSHEESKGDVTISSADDSTGGFEATEDDAATVSQLRLTISQIDVSKHPNVTLYLDVRDGQSDPVTDLDAESIAIEEVSPSGEIEQCQVMGVNPVSKGGSTYIVTYATNISLGTGYYMTVKVSCDEQSGYSGTAETTYQVPITQSQVVVSEEEPHIETTPEPQQSTVNSEYVLPDSNRRYYTESELVGLSDWELEIARNEIFARHGRGFKDSELQNYFNSCSWYTRLYSPEEYDAKGSQLNKYEAANVALIKRIEDSR